MYIEKYWYHYIGGTDDSLTLVDYLCDKGQAELSLSEIFADTGLDRQHGDFRTSLDLAYTDAEGRSHEFYYAIDLVTDLAALLLESSKSGGFRIQDLFEGETRNLFVNITATPQEAQAMNRALADFSAAPLAYDLSELMDAEDLQEMARDCEAVRAELYEP